MVKAHSSHLKLANSMNMTAFHTWMNVTACNKMNITASNTCMNITAPDICIILQHLIYAWRSQRAIFARIFEYLIYAWILQHVVYMYERYSIWCMYEYMSQIWTGQITSNSTQETTGFVRLCSCLRFNRSPQKSTWLDTPRYDGHHVYRIKQTKTQKLNEYYIYRYISIHIYIYIYIYIYIWI